MFVLSWRIVGPLVLVALCFAALRLESELLSEPSRLPQGDWRPTTTAWLRQVATKQHGNLVDRNSSALAVSSSDKSFAENNSSIDLNSNVAPSIDDPSRPNQAEEHPLVISYCTFKQTDRPYVSLLRKGRAMVLTCLISRRTR
jgi:hypothetical protein